MLLLQGAFSKEWRSTSHSEKPFFSSALGSATDKKAKSRKKEKLTNKKLKKTGLKHKETGPSYNVRAQTRTTTGLNGIMYVRWHFTMSPAEGALSAINLIFSALTDLYFHLVTLHVQENGGD